MKTRRVNIEAILALILLLAVCLTIIAMKVDLLYDVVRWSILAILMVYFGWKNSSGSQS